MCADYSEQTNISHDVPMSRKHVTNNVRMHTADGCNGILERREDNTGITNTTCNGHLAKRVRPIMLWQNVLLQIWE